MEKPQKSEIGPKYPDSWSNQETQDFSVGKAKLESLKDLVEEINELIAERKMLSDKFVREGEKMKREINNFLLESSPKNNQDMSEFARERAELRKKQIEISEIQLNEQVGCWRDIALLKAELRERAKELTEKESRAEEIRKILEED
jgi:hypothetical protein